MFNLKKFSGKKKALETSDKQLEKERSKMGTATDVDGGTTDQRLEDLRKDPEGDETTDLQLDKVRISDRTNGKTTDGQLGHHKSPDGFVPMRTNTEDRKFYGLPINEMAEANDQKMAKDIEASDSLDTDTKFWDSTFAKESPTALAPSQLNNNQDRVSSLTPENVVKNPQLKEMVMASLKDADAMLYYIYHSAARQMRDLTNEENSLVNGITSDKMKIGTLLGIG